MPETGCTSIRRTPWFTLYAFPSLCPRHLADFASLEPRNSNNLEFMVYIDFVGRSIFAAAVCIVLLLGGVFVADRALVVTCNQPECPTSAVYEIYRQKVRIALNTSQQVVQAAQVGIRCSSQALAVAPSASVGPLPERCVNRAVAFHHPRLSISCFPWLSFFTMAFMELSSSMSV